VCECTFEREKESKRERETEQERETERETERERELMCVCFTIWPKNKSIFFSKSFHRLHFFSF